MDPLRITLLIAFAALGAGVGWAFCLILRRTIVYLLPERRSPGRYAAWAILRVAMVAGGFVAAAWLDTWCAVTYSVGFFLARTMVLAGTRAAPGTEEERHG